MHFRPDSSTKYIAIRARCALDHESWLKYVTESRFGCSLANRCRRSTSIHALGLASEPSPLSTVERAHACARSSSRSRIFEREGDDGVARCHCRCKGISCNGDSFGLNLPHLLYFDYQVLSISFYSEHFHGTLRGKTKYTM